MAFVFEYLQGTYGTPTTMNRLHAKEREKISHNKASALICMVLSLHVGESGLPKWDKLSAYKAKFTIPRTSRPPTPSCSKPPRAFSLMR
jgi:hypothetical protein